MPSATLLRPRSLHLSSQTFLKGVKTPVSLTVAKNLENDKRFKVEYANGENHDEAEDEADEQGRPTQKAARIVAIAKAIGGLDKEKDYTNAGVPDARSLTRDLGWQVTAAERDAAFDEFKAGDKASGTGETPLQRHGGEEVQEPNAPGTGNNQTLKGTVQSEPIVDSKIDPNEKSDLGNNAPQNKLVNDTGSTDNGNEGIEPNMQQPETNADGTDKAIANADGSPKGPSKLDPKEKGDMPANAFGGAAGDNPELHKGARASARIETANGPDDQLGVVNATGAPLQAAEQAGTTDPETEPSRKVGLKLTKHRNPQTGELTDQAVQSKGPKAGEEDEDADPSKSGAKEI